jgi:NAD+ diphosphatase
MKAPIAFAGSPIDRADHIRANPDELAALMNWRARLLKLDGLSPVYTDDGALEWADGRQGLLCRRAR